MNFFCTSPQTSRELNRHIAVTFTGTELQTYFNTELVDTRPATVGECYQFVGNGSQVPPCIIKLNVPDTRGARICWGLSFCEETKRASSYADFMSRFIDVAESYNPDGYYVVISKNNYAFLFGQKITKSGANNASKRSDGLKPLLSWVSDDISGSKLYKMLEIFQGYRKIHCPIEFLTF